MITQDKCIWANTICFFILILQPGNFNEHFRESVVPYDDLKKKNTNWTDLIGCF